MEKKTRIFQDSISKLFGLFQQIHQPDATSFYPGFPYAVVKMYVFMIVKNIREAYNRFACNGTIFHHEPPLFAENSVFSKITCAVERIGLGMGSILYLGNLDMKRDWADSKDYLDAMWLMLRVDE